MVSMNGAVTHALAAFVLPPQWFTGLNHVGDAFPHDDLVHIDDGGSSLRIVYKQARHFPNPSAEGRDERRIVWLSAVASVA